MKRSSGLYLLLLVCFFACGNPLKKQLVNGNGAYWRIVQDGDIKSDSFNVFFDIKANGSVNELLLKKNKFYQTDFNPDVLSYKKWRIIDDSTVEIFFVPYHIMLLNDSIFVGINKKRSADTLKLILYKLK